MTDRRSAAAVLTGEDGNVAVSVVFVIFMTLFLSIIVASLLSALGQSTQSRNAGAAARGVSEVASAYLDKAAAGNVPDDGELCTRDLCGTVTAGSSDEGANVTVTVTVGESARTRTIPVPAAAGAVITGFDKDGNAVWGPLPAGAPKEDQP